MGLFSCPFFYDHFKVLLLVGDGEFELLMEVL